MHISGWSLRLMTGRGIKCCLSVFGVCKKSMCFCWNQNADRVDQLKTPLIKGLPSK